MPFSLTTTATDEYTSRTAPLLPRQRNVAERAQERLRAQPYRQLWLIVCECHEGLLTLRGVVSSYYLKQVAQTAVMRLDGVEEVTNRLDVCYPPSISRHSNFDPV